MCFLAAFMWQNRTMNTFNYFLGTLTLLCGGALASVAAPVGAPQTVQHMPQHAPVAQVPPVTKEKARNVILMIGDGMGSEHVWAAWLCNGGKLNLELLPVTGFSRTISASHTITDSAAGGTAIACGHKAINGQLGITPQGKPLTSMMKHFQRAGKQSGLVVTKAITDATPAAFYAHRSSRSDHAGIAQDLVKSGCQVVIGGGASVVSAQQVESLSRSGALVKLAAPVHCPPASQRGAFLEKAVAQALERLEGHSKGFFLMIEGSAIDTAGHENNLAEVVQETLDFDRTLGVVLRWMKKHPDTLLVVTADHQTGGLSILNGDVKKGQVTASFATSSHSGVAVPIYATGAGAAAFRGVMENTEITGKILKAAGVNP